MSLEENILEVVYILEVSKLWIKNVMSNFNVKVSKLFVFVCFGNLFLMKRLYI